MLWKFQFLPQNTAVPVNEWISFAPNRIVFFFLPFQKMEKIREDFLDEDMHTDSNMFVLLVICHGEDGEYLLDKDEKPAWNTNELATDLSAVRSLKGRPKLLIIQACRGGKYSTYRRAGM